MPTDLNREGLEAAKVKPLDLANVIRDAFLAGAGMDTASKEAKRIPADILGRLNSYDPEHVPAYHRIVAVIRTHLTRAKPGRMALLVEALDRAHDRMATLDGVDNDDLCAIIDASAALSTVPAKSAAGVGLIEAADLSHDASDEKAIVADSGGLSAEGEPVAWQHEITEPNRPAQVLLSRSSDNPWSTWTEDHLGECAYSATPLYASPPAAAPAEPVVKPLEWREFGPDALIAHGPYGHYKIEPDAHPDFAVVLRPQGQSFESVELAKACAEADYQKRVRSCLLPAAAGVPEGWAPIETAPKDRSAILLYEDEDEGLGPFIGYWSGVQWLPLTASTSWETWPTHWMLLPSRPTGEGGR